MSLSQAWIRIKRKLFYELRLSERLQHWDDSRYLRLRFWVQMSEHLDLESPKTFNQKLQWLKIHDRQAIYTTMADKHEVKRWVADNLGSRYVVPSLGVWDSFDDIPFDDLPETFVLKCTHDSGGFAICSDRSTFDISAARDKLENSRARNYYLHGREWPYKDVPPRILAEVYLPTWNPSGGVVSSTIEPDWTAVVSYDPDEIVDYKFYCFHGEPKFLYVSQGIDDEVCRISFLSCDWAPIGFSRSDYPNFEVIPPRPAAFDEMIRIARKLSDGIPFVRVDLFEHQGHVLFSEMTFHPVSGWMPFTPKLADIEVGALLNLEHLATRP